MRIIIVTTIIIALGMTALAHMAVAQCMPTDQACNTRHLERFARDAEDARHNRRMEQLQEEQNRILSEQSRVPQRDINRCHVQKGQLICQ